MSYDAKAREIAENLHSWVPDEDIAMLAAALRSARNEALEEADKVAGPAENESWSCDMMLASHIIRARILALKTTTPSDPNA
jgi:hypothetical protein